MIHDLISNAEPTATNFNISADLHLEISIQLLKSLFTRLRHVRRVAQSGGTVQLPGDEGEREEEELLRRIQSRTSKIGRWGTRWTGEGKHALNHHFIDL